MPIPLQTLAASLAAVVGLMVVLWVLNLRLWNASIVDVFWGRDSWWRAWRGSAGVGRASPRAVLALSLVIVWAARLAVQIYLRNRGRGEDFRYRAMRQRAGGRFACRSLFEAFLLQAVLLWLVSHPLQVVMTASEAGRLGGLDAVTVAVWLIGLAFEAIGDLQLARFWADSGNRRRVLRTGLWG